MTVPEPASGAAPAEVVDVKALRDLATMARRALEQGGFELVSLEAFPSGACGDVSEMLGQLLTDRGLGVWQYVSHRCPPSHAWLELDGWIINITADQFNDRAEYGPAQRDVIVTQDRCWHEKHFRPDARPRIADMSYFRPGTLGDPARRDFDVLKQRISTRSASR